MITFLIFVSTAFILLYDSGDKNGNWMGQGPIIHKGNGIEDHEEFVSMCIGRDHIAYLEEIKRLEEWEEKLKREG